MSAEEDALRACQKLLEVHPYTCLCGAGIIDGDDCEYHLALDEAIMALSEVGYAPSWYKRNMAALAAVMKGDGNETVRTENEEAPGDGKLEGSVGARPLGNLPNCS